MLHIVYNINLCLDNTFCQNFASKHTFTGAGLLLIVERSSTNLLYHADIKFHLFDGNQWFQSIYDITRFKKVASPSQRRLYEQFRFSKSDVVIHLALPDSEN